MSNLNIIHVGVDKYLKSYLLGSGTCFFFPLTFDNLKLITNRNKIQAITLKTQSKVTKELLDYFPKLLLLITRTVGTDHIDLDACKKKDIAVYNIPDYGAYNIAEHAFALLLSVSRNIIQANKQTKRGKFSYEEFLGTALKGKILGVVGTGKIGIEFIKRAKAFELEILAFDVIENKEASKTIGFLYVSLDELLKRSRIISLHVPLLPTTKHMIGKREIKRMREGAILINTSRGAIIDTKALIKNIKKFKAVCLDVLENEEQFSKKHPLPRYKNVIITPHMAFYSDESVKTIAKETLANIKRFEKGDRTNRVL